MKTTLKSCLTKDDVINSIRLDLRHPSGGVKVWVLVEGETDVKLFTKLLTASHVHIEIAHGGFGSLLQCVAELLKETERIIGIRDADFLHLEGRDTAVEHIFLTDAHDAEMMLIACDHAYHAVITEYFPKTAAPAREALLRSLAFLGGLRWLNETERAELNFSGLGVGDFYDGEAMMLDESKCLTVVLKRSPNKQKDISLRDVHVKIEHVSDFFNLCNGHDIQKAFALCVSAHAAKGVNDVEIGKAFRLAYRFEDFQKTGLFRQLAEWSHQHAVHLFGHNHATC